MINFDLTNYFGKFFNNTYKKTELALNLQLGLSLLKAYFLAVL